jgi:hypothetical protein
MNQTICWKSEFDEFLPKEKVLRETTCTAEESIIVEQGGSRILTKDVVSCNNTCIMVLRDYTSEGKSNIHERQKVDRRDYGESFAPWFLSALNHSQEIYSKKMHIYGTMTAYVFI